MEQVHGTTHTNTTNQKLCPLCHAPLTASVMALPRIDQTARRVFVCTACFRTHSSLTSSDAVNINIIPAITASNYTNH